MSRFCSVLSVFAVLIAGISGAADDSAVPLTGDEANKVLKYALEAYRARMSFTSASGKGVVEHFHTKGKNQVLVSKADVEFVFDKPKYWVQLDYHPNLYSKLGAKRQVIIFDGNHWLTGFFSEGFMPLGCEGHIYEAEGQVNQLFLWDPSDVTNNIANMDDIKAKVGFDKIEIKRTTTGDYDCNYTLPNTDRISCCLTISPTYGYNITRAQFFSTRTQKLTQMEEVNWKLFGMIWFAERYLKDLGYRNERRVFSVTNLESDAKPDPSRFTIDGLGLKEGARILDMRSTTPPEESVFWYTKSRNTRVEDLNSILNELKEPPRDPEDTHESSALPNGFYIFNGIAAVLLVGAGLWLFFVQRRR